MYPHFCNVPGNHHQIYWKRPRAFLIGKHSFNVIIAVAEMTSNCRVAGLVVLLTMAWLKVG